MKDISKYQGIIPAFYACYDDKGEISPQAVETLTEYFIKKGVKGLYIGGSSGECIYHSVDERKKTLEAVMGVARGRLTIIAHVACNNTADSVELARHAQSQGVDAIAAIPPIYFHLPPYAIADYWNAMSSAASDTEFIIYNIPQLAGTELTLPLFKEMLKNPRVVGVKNSSMPVQDIETFKIEGTRDGRQFVVFNGPDEQLVSGLVMGADGGIGGTYGAMPELVCAIYDLVQKGDIARARAVQHDVFEIIMALCSGKGNMYAMIKETLRRREGIDIGGVRAPMYGLVPEDEESIARCVRMIDDAIARWTK